MRARHDDGGPPEPVEHPSVGIVEELLAEVERTANIGTNINDDTSTKNDWVAYVIAYLGRAADKVFRNQRENQDYRANLIKAGGLIISALVANDIKENSDPVAEVADF